MLQDVFSTPVRLIKALPKAVQNWSENRTGRMAAALAYYSIFSLGPLLLLVISIAGLFYGSDAVRGRLTGELRSIVGSDGAGAVEALLAGASTTSSGAIGTLISLFFLVLAALGVVIQLKDAFNKIWDAKNKNESALSWYVRSYATSLAGILAIGFLLVVSLVLSAGLSGLSEFGGVSFNVMIARLLSEVFGFFVLTLLFAMMFRWLPDEKNSWRAVLPGAAFTALLFALGKYAIGWYVGTQSFSSTYGAAASFIVLLVWVYYSSSIVLFGAEVTHAMAETEPPNTTSQ